MSEVKEKTKEDPKAPAGSAEHDPKTGELVEVKGGGLPAEFEGYGADQGQGFENQTSEDISVPFMVILQPGSPEVQVDPEKPPFPGYIVNKTTGDTYKGSEGIVFIPALTEHLMVEWRHRDAGGGLVAQHAIDSDISRRVRETQPLGVYRHPDADPEDKLPNQLIETFYVYGVMTDEAKNPWPVVMAFSSTHIKPYKDWMYRARSVVINMPDGRKLTQLPLFSHAYRVTSLKKEGGGNTWYVPVVTFAGEDAKASRLLPSSELYQAAKAVHTAVSSGALKADADKLQNDRADAAPRKGSTDKKEAPY